MCQARRLEYVRLIVEEGLNYTQPHDEWESPNAPARFGGTGEHEQQDVTSMHQSTYLLIGSVNI